MAKDFYGEYLRDLAALDGFLARRHRGAHAVEPEDPDVRRLMESLAFFSARTRAAATNELRGAISQLTNGLLDDFMLPQPARLMMRVRPRLGMSEPAFLPRGTAVEVATAEAVEARFSTMRDLTIEPLELDRALCQPRNGNGVRVLLRLRAFNPRPPLSTPLSIQVSLPGGDYLRSREFFWLLERRLARVGVVYDESPAGHERGLDCRVSVGERLAGPDSAAVLSSEQRSMQRSGAIAKIREFFHFPEKELRFEVELPFPEARRVWRQAWLLLDFDEWPEGQGVNPEMFRLHMVPIENLSVGDAQPLKADGTQTCFRVSPGDDDAELAFHSLCEVSQEKPSGVELLLPSYLAATDESYSLEFEDGRRDRPMLRLQLPGAFLEPRLVSVRARWYQPSFDRRAFGKLRAKLLHRHVDGASFEIVGSLTNHRDSPLWADPTAALHVLSRRSKWELGRDDLMMLMSVLGADTDSHHGKIVPLVRRVDVRDAPATVDGNRAGVMHVYQVALADEARAPELRGLVDDYLREAERLLDTWSNNLATVRRDEPAKRRSA